MPSPGPCLHFPPPFVALLHPSSPPSPSLSAASCPPAASRILRSMWRRLHEREKVQSQRETARSLTGPFTFPWSSGSLLEKPSNALLHPQGALAQPAPQTVPLHHERFSLVQPWFPSRPGWNARTRRVSSCPLAFLSPSMNHRDRSNKLPQVKRAIPILIGSTALPARHEPRVIIIGDAYRPKTLAIQAVGTKYLTGGVVFIPEHVRLNKRQSSRPRGLAESGPRFFCPCCLRW